MILVTTRLKIEGLKHVPARGGAIIAPNHLSVHDSTLLMAVLPRMVRSIGKSDYVDNPLTRFAFLALGNIAVDRSSGDSGKAALDAAVQVIEGGGLFAIFPEGTRSRDGLLHKGKTGAARLALRTGAPIIPVGIIGTDKMQGVDDPMYVLRPGAEVTIRFGEAMSIERYRNRGDQSATPRQLTDDLMYEISLLSGQRYVDEYMQRPDEVA